MKVDSSVELMGKAFLLENEVAHRLYHNGEMIRAACYHKVQRYLFER